jgi:hypothetical protein
VGLGRSTAVLVACAAGVAAAVAIGARWSDGPIGPIAGGPFRSGQLVSGSAIDWRVLADTRTVELQLVDPPRSRTTHVVVLDGQAYIPSGIVKAGPFVFVRQAFWKRWPHQALEDPRVLLRSQGRLYRARAVRVTDPRLHRELSALASAKYHFDLEAPPDPERVWFFRLEPGV